MSKVMYQSDADRAAAEREFDDKVKSMKRAAAALQRKLNAKRYRNIDAAIRAAGELALDAAADVVVFAAHDRATGEVADNYVDVRCAVGGAIYAYMEIDDNPRAPTDASVTESIYNLVTCTDTVEEAVVEGRLHRPADG